MFKLLDQRNIYTSLGYVRDHGPVIKTTIHYRKLVNYGGHVWYEAKPILYTYITRLQHSSFNKKKPAAPYLQLMQQSRADIEADPKQAQLVAEREAEERAQRERVWIELNKSISGNIGGFVYEEEEEPEFIKKLGKETEEDIQLILEQEENYFVARFDFH